MSEDYIREEALVKIIERCRIRLLKHTKVLERMLRFVGNQGSNQLISPQPIFPEDEAESLQDIELLGNYCGATYDSYMQLCKHRLKQLKELVARILLSNPPSALQDLVSLTKLAFQIRRSCSFKKLVAYNISRLEKPGIAVPELRDIVERIGQISKFYRAAVTLTTFLGKLERLGIGLEIKATFAERIEIPELACRTVADVRRRGGDGIISSSRANIQGMLNRWPAYREHVELQLIIFYVQHHTLTLFSPYIGCNKRSCYLCYKFIAEHGRFQVDGCHQSLYSLWTIRESICFADEEKAGAFNGAIKKLCLDLQQKVQAQKSLHWRRRGFSTHNESVANLSRVSLAVNDRSLWESCLENRENDAVIISNKGGFRAILNKKPSNTSYVADLNPVPEESPEEVTEAGTKRESLLGDVDSAAESVDISHGTSYPQKKGNVGAPQTHSHAEAVVSVGSILAAPVSQQDVSGDPVIEPILDTLKMNRSNDVTIKIQDKRVPDRPRRKHQQRNQRDHQSRHSPSLQYDPHISRRSNKAVAIDRNATRRRGDKRARTASQRESHSSRRRAEHKHQRKRGGSLKHRLIGIMKAVFMFFKQ